MMSSLASDNPEQTINTDLTVYERIKLAILGNRLPPGANLTEEKLSGIFEVSRERMRKVLQRLSCDKCVELKPNRGAFVAKPSVREALEVIAARLLTESRMVDLLAQASGNGVLTEILRDLVARSSLISEMYGWRLFSLCANDEHAEFLKRLRLQKDSHAKRIMKQFVDTLEGRPHFEGRSLAEEDLAEVFRAGMGA